MAQNIHHFKNFSATQDGVKIKLNMDRFSKQFNQAQWKLDGMVMNSMVPFMPHANGTFIQKTRAESASMAGSGKVCAGTRPYGRYLYMGKVMVDEATGKGPMKFISKYGAETFRFRKGARLKVTDRDLKFSKKHNPKVQAHWFDAAKKADGEKWVKAVKQIAGGG